MSEELIDEKSDVDLVTIKNKISAIKDLPIEAHSDEFEQIHFQLKQALTNLDGV